LAVLVASTSVSAFGGVRKLSSYHRPSKSVRTFAQQSASVLIVVPSSDSNSPFGLTSPRPGPSWNTVATHLSKRIGYFDERLSAKVVTEDDLGDHASAADIVLALGCHAPSTASSLKQLTSSSEAPAKALLTHLCSDHVEALERVGTYTRSDDRAGLLKLPVLPWSKEALGKRLLAQARTLLARHSSEDTLYALFFVLHACVMPLELVQYSVNPSWEKSLWGVPGLGNVQEFAKMIRCCGPTIFAALSDPTTKEAIDLLNEVDLRDQVGSYRILVSYETPYLEDFSLCILQQNNCFNCDAKIIDKPQVPVLGEWRGKPLTQETSREILVGHFAYPPRTGEDEQARPTVGKEQWSWKVVCGANPAYDAFPAQHQTFYPSEKNPKHLWYDPVFKVETVDGRSVWCKRHYKCTPRTQATTAPSGPTPGPTPGLWTLTTLDNGVGSRELWTIVDAADDLEWAVLHYTGVAARAGSSYVGALLCSKDGQWPESARPPSAALPGDSVDGGSGAGGANGDSGTASSTALQRIESAFHKCGLEFWELYGHGPPLTAAAAAAGSKEGGEGVGGGQSFMWSQEHEEWAQQHPPPLEPIGEMTVQAWRKLERAKDDAAAASSSA